MINTETKKIWDNNREQLMYIGRNFKRDIWLNSFQINTSKLRPNRSWLDLFSLYLSYRYLINKFDFTNLTDNLSEDEVIIIDSHDDIFKEYQIHFWWKDSISIILPAIKCPSFKSENKIFKTSEIEEIGNFMYDQNHIKSLVIENADEELSLILVYCNIIKTGPNTFNVDQHTKFFDKIKERYEIWEIGDCACKPNKIRVRVNKFENLKHTIDQLKLISNTNDVKLGIGIDFKLYSKSFSGYDTMVFNNSFSLMSDRDTNFIFTGDTLAIVYDGNYYNFRLDQRTKESENSFIKGKI